MPPVNTWFMAGGKIIGRGPGRFMNFGRGREGPGVVILAGARAPVEHCCLLTTISYPRFKIMSSYNVEGYLKYLASPGKDKDKTPLCLERDHNLEVGFSPYNNIIPPNLKVRM